MPTRGHLQCLGKWKKKGASCPKGGFALHTAEYK